HGELLRADHAVGFGCGPSMQGNNARASKQFVESDALHEITEGLRLRVRIIDEHMTPEAAKYPGDAGADRTEADQSGDGILELDPTLVVVVVIPAPVAFLERGVGFGNPAHHGEDQARGVLRGSCSVAAGGVAD